MTDNRTATDATPDRGVLPGATDVFAGSRRRRYLLYCLYAHGRTQPLPTVADQITLWERATEVGPRPDDPLKHRLRVYSALYHDHLPVLCDLGVVDYHQAEDVVELDDRGRGIRADLEAEYADEITRLLDADRESTGP